jgi:hypothetical protein
MNIILKSLSKNRVCGYGLDSSGSLQVVKRVFCKLNNELPGSVKVENFLTILTTVSIAGRTLFSGVNLFYFLSSGPYRKISTEISETVFVVRGDYLLGRTNAFS